jgi:hypothetical protein
VTASTGALEESTTFDFEDVSARISGAPAALPITDEYRERGVTFPNGVTALVFDDTSLPPRPDLPRSGEQVITTCYSIEFCTNRIDLTFNPPLERIELFAGSRRQIDDDAALVLQTLDATGAVLDSTAEVFEASRTVVPADRLLSLDDADGRIAGAALFWVENGTRLDGLIVDDLTIVPFVPPSTTEPETTSTTVTISTTTTTARETTTTTDGPGEPVDPLVVAGFLAVLVVVAVVVIVVLWRLLRVVARQARRLTRPTEEATPRPTQPRPAVAVRADPGAQVIVDDTDPRTGIDSNIVAKFGLADATITITEEDEP